ncbi:hypothetical protein DPEC_G00250420 [Dallia pectoralis]|uniref:Uncharacterized protein n=1 Tax=Dallia pectoralis TaxID=75939 RepID=A0ACC2FT55_DALPE|nr:hypothetical protein DPEC_G00250420 [Dallia pectoralis]
MCNAHLDPVVVPLDSEDDKGEHSEPEREEDIGITFVARKVPDTPKDRPKSVPSILEVCQSPSVAPPSPTCGERNLPWKGGIGTLPVCVSMETTKIIPIDLQQAWNQSISSLESLASPSIPPEPLHPRVSALSRLGGPRPVSFSGSGVSGPSYNGAGGGSRSIVAQGIARFEFPRGEEKEEEERALSDKEQEMQPLMSSSVRPSGPPPPPPSSLGLGRRRNPCVYLRSLVTSPPAGVEPLARSRGPTQL